MWGSYKFSTHSGHRYFLTIVDDFTRATWVYLLKLKSDAFVALKQFIALVKTQFSMDIKIVPSDNGIEFLNPNAIFCFLLWVLFIEVFVFVHLNKMV